MPSPGPVPPHDPHDPQRDPAHDPAPGGSSAPGPAGPPGQPAPGAAPDPDPAGPRAAAPPSATGRDDSNRSIGAILIGAGALVLLFRLVGGVPWPLFVLLPGLAMLGAALFGGRRLAGLAEAGGAVTAVGAVLAWQSATGAFQTWAYAWALVVAGAAAGRWLRGRREGDAAAIDAGARDTRRALALFAVFALGFELLIFRGIEAPWRIVLPLGLIAAGVALLVRPDRDHDGVGSGTGDGERP